MNSSPSWCRGYLVLLCTIMEESLAMAHLLGLVMADMKQLMASCSPSPTDLLVELAIVVRSQLDGDLLEVPCWAEEEGGGTWMMMSCFTSWASSSPALNT